MFASFSSAKFSCSEHALFLQVGDMRADVNDEALLADYRYNAVE